MPRIDRVRDPEVLQIAPECLNCPDQKALQASFNKVQSSILEASELSLILLGREDIGALDLRSNTEVYGSKGLSDGDVKRIVAEGLNRADDFIEATKEMSRDLSGSCDGTLEVQVEKSGTAYMLKMCTSTIAHAGSPQNADNESEMLVNVRTRRVE